MVGLVTISCPNCPRELQIRTEHVGRKVSCKFCSGVFRVPRHTLFSCPKCSREGMVRTEYLGQKVRCKFCHHVLRALSKDAVGRNQGEFEVKRLIDALAHREAEVEELRNRLEVAQSDLLGLDTKARNLTDERDRGQRTQEWSVVEEELHPPESENSNGTEPDLPLADLDHSEPDFEHEPVTQIESEGMREPDLTKTRLAEPDDSVESLREECSRLRDELDAIRERSERTVITRDHAEILERELQIARADNVRLASERVEIQQAAEGLMKLVHERELALMDLARERDESRTAFDFAETARLTLAEELDALKRAHAELSSPGSVVEDGSDAEGTDRRILVVNADVLAEAESRCRALTEELDRLKQAHTEATTARQAIGEALEQTRAERDSILGEFEQLKTAHQDQSKCHESTQSEKEYLSAELARIRQQFESARSENEALTSEIERLRSQNDQVRSEKNVLVDELEQTRGQFESSQSDRLGIVAELETLRRVHGELESANAAYSATLKKSEVERASQGGELERLRILHTQNVTALEASKAEAQRLEAEKNAAVEELARARQSQDQIRKFSETSTESLRKAVAENATFKTEIERLTKELSKATSDQRDASNAFQRSEFEKKALTLEVDRLKKEAQENAAILAQSRPDLDADPTSWAGRAREAEMALSKLRFQFAASDADAKSLRSRMAENEARVDEWKKRVEALTVENIATIREWKARFARVEAERDELSERLKQMTIMPDPRSISCAQPAEMD